MPHEINTEPECMNQNDTLETMLYIFIYTYINPIIIMFVHTNVVYKIIHYDISFKLRNEILIIIPVCKSRANLSI